MIFCLAKGHLFIGKRLSFGKQKITFCYTTKKTWANATFRYSPKRSVMRFIILPLLVDAVELFVSVNDG
ncbi:hypothetical protein HMPREF0647_06995 [Prevotella bivia DNF00320]|uniref:Uncharacterized protein n=1 Tax=Prevotella bivia DNF00320 TaxID=1401068 RepID=A0A096ABT9_9BACT|nr:hypothetical protein HMPREF0647_06995 [Prevotella bivia DNF00320]